MAGSHLMPDVEQFYAPCSKFSCLIDWPLDACAWSAWSAVGIVPACKTCSSVGGMMRGDVRSCRLLWKHGKLVLAFETYRWKLFVKLTRKSTARWDESHEVYLLFWLSPTKSLRFSLLGCWCSSYTTAVVFCPMFLLKRQKARNVDDNRS